MRPRVIVALAAPQVEWETDAETGRRFVYNPDVCGEFAWAQLHSWAENIRDHICANCGSFAQAAARALHDVVNVNLGRRAMYPEDLRMVAELMYEAVWRARELAVDEGDDEMNGTLAQIDELLAAGRAIPLARGKRRPQRIVISP